MNYLDLQTAIIEDTHRPDLATLVPRFVSECEGMIRRELIAHLLTAQLADIDRVSPNSPIYNLAPGVVILRTIAQTGEVSRELQRVALGSLHQYALSGAIRVYGEAGDGTVELRGNPATGQTLDYTYYGMPPNLVDDTDTNTLLEENETLYKSGAMFFLYQNTQDRELASDQINIFNSVIENLNEQISRKIGGAAVTSSYNFTGGSTY